MSDLDNAEVTQTPVRRGRPPRQRSEDEVTPQAKYRVEQIKKDRELAKADKEVGDVWYEVNARGKVKKCERRKVSGNVHKTFVGFADKHPELLPGLKAKGFAIKQVF